MIQSHPCTVLICTDILNFQCRTSERKSALLDLIPTATDDEVESALTEAYGDVDGAAQQLLGNYF